MRGSELRAAIAAIPEHSIGGYEWECYSCHWHSSRDIGTACYRCERPIGMEGYFFQDGKPSDCGSAELTDRRTVLALLDLTHKSHTSDRRAKSAIVALKGQPERETGAPGETRTHDL